MLHKNVYWLGKQWAVTGYGVQAVSNKLEMKFDVEALRIWQDGLDETLSAEPWFNAEDFSEALSIARKRSQADPTSYWLPYINER